MKSILCLTILVAASRAVMAQCSCDHCGCQASCQKVCRLVCETKKVPKITYDCQCEDFCVPGPSIRSTACDECGHKHHVYTPQCAKLRTRTKLIKNETTEEKVVYKWVVENVCCDCAQKPGTSTDDGQQVAARATDPLPGRAMGILSARAVDPPNATTSTGRTAR